jgi:tRNA nucleotidyltransferase (CCA-adding enzyme)
MQDVAIQLPDKVRDVIGRLTGAGFEAYAVGGCVRDSILGRAPEDWDITTSASPSEVKGLFSKTVDTGIQHGTVTVICGGEGFEVTTYRIDGEYEDKRHPKEVVFTSNLLEDLKRRDFTINAMAYNAQEGLVDAFGGLSDLQEGIIRCVGSPQDRFTEDALRMLRAVRFAAQLGFAIEEETEQAIPPLAGNLRDISAERIQAELVKLLVSAHPEKMRTVYETGMSQVFLPEFDRMMETPQNNCHHIYNVGDHTLVALQNIPRDKILRLTMLLHDVAKPECQVMDGDGIYHFYGHPAKGAAMAGQILRRLKFDNGTIERVTSLVACHDELPTLREAPVRRAIHRIGLRQFPDLFAVKRADALAKSPHRQEEKLAYIDKFERMYQEIMDRQQCLTREDLAVTGKDLIRIGIEPGKKMGELLEYLLQCVLECPEQNTPEQLIQLAEQKRDGNGSA